MKEKSTINDDNITMKDNKKHRSNVSLNGNQHPQRIPSGSQSETEQKDLDALEKIKSHQKKVQKVALIMTQKLILIRFIVFLIGVATGMKEKIETIYYENAKNDIHALATYEFALEFHSLFHQEIHFSSVVTSTLVCPDNYQLCNTEFNKRECVKTNKSTVNVKRKTNNQTTTTKYKDCIPTTTMDAKIYQLFSFNQNFLTNMDNVLCKSSCCVINGYMEDEAIQTRYLVDENHRDTSVEQFQNAVKRMKNNKKDTAKIQVLQFHYEIFCGTKEEVESYEKSSKKKKQEKTDYRSFFMVVIIVCGVVVLFAIISCICKNHEPEVGHDDVDTNADTEFSTHSSDFIMSIDDLQKIQMQQNDDELSGVVFSFSDSDHLQEASEKVNNDISESSINFSENTNEKINVQNSHTSSMSFLNSKEDTLETNLEKETDTTSNSEKEQVEDGSEKKEKRKTSKEQKQA